MVKLPYAAAAALQFLWQNKIRISSGSNRIFDFPPKELIYDFSPSETKFSTQDLASTARRVQEISYDDLLRHKLVISARTVTRRRFHKQQVEYFIGRLGKAEDYGFVPRGHRLLYDLANNELMLEGPNTSTYTWIKVGAVQAHKEQKVDANEQAEIFKKGLASGRGIRIVDVPELPIMVTDNFELICIENLRDEPVIGIVGGRSMGKSWALNSLVGRVSAKWGKVCAIVNDWNGECEKWVLPWPAKSYQVEDLFLLGERTQPLPGVFLYLKTNPVAQNIFYEKEGVSQMFSLSFSDIVQNPASFLSWNRSWRFRNSETWFRNLFMNEDGTYNTEWDKIRNISDFEKMVKQKLGSSNITEKINTVMRDVFNKGFVDFVSGTPSKWKVETEKETRIYPPWIACMYAGIIPIFETAAIKDKDYFPFIMAHFAGEILKTASTDPYFKNNKLQCWVFVDELLSILRKDKTRLAVAAFDELAASGRPNRVGLVYTALNYGQLTDTITSNTDYILAFKQSHADATRLRSDYAFSNAWLREMKVLGVRECIAVTTKRKFVVYDLRGNREENEGPFRGHPFYPLNQHTQPR